MAGLRGIEPLLPVLETGVLAVNTIALSFYYYLRLNVFDKFKKAKFW